MFIPIDTVRTLCTFHILKIILTFHDRCVNINLRRVDFQTGIFIKNSVTKMNFDGQVILISGAGSGIGAATAKYLSKLGGKLVIVDINRENLQKVASDIVENGSQFAPLVIVADVTKDAERIISETTEHFGKLNVLINNVGIVARHGLMDLQIEVFDRIIATNVRTEIFPVRLFVVCQLI